MTTWLSGETIAAFATPPGQSGLAVLRLSGPEAAALCDRLFKPYGTTFPKPSEMPGYTMAPGIWGGLDEVVLSAFRAPHSYTGEDVYEISCHGGRAVREGILRSLIEHGARLAEPGEFSKRAFINGKMDLSRAEAVMDLIQAEASRQADMAFRQLRGRLARNIRCESDRLYALLAQLETLMDWDEEEARPEDVRAIADGLAASEMSLSRLARSFRYGRLVREGLSVVIAGRPNAGKSSLMNALTEENRAIVSHIPGTTRDTIETELSIDGYLIRLIDTAGLAVDTPDPIEREGIERAEAALQRADLILWVLSPPLGDADALADERDHILELHAEGKPMWLILGKDDLAGTAETDAPRRFAERDLPGLPTLPWSVRRPEDLEKLRAGLTAFIEKGGLADVERAPMSDSSGEAVMTHTRHKELIDRAVASVRHARDLAQDGQAYDLIATSIRAALDALAGLTGDDVSETLIETIFSRFCIGK